MRVLRWTGIGVLVLFTAVYFRNYLFFENLHPIIEDQIYRSAQPTAAGLERAVASIGLRSVINLKSDDPDDETPDSAEEVARDADLDLRYVRLSGRRWPSPQEVRDLIANLDSAPRPMLIHCQGGTDRSGLAAGVALLLADRNLDEADDQFALRYGYPGTSLGSDLPGFFAQYREWLAANGESHNAARFRSWVEDDYIPYYYEAQIEFDLPAQPVRAGVPFNLVLRVANRSEHAIPLRCAEAAGVRASVRLKVLAPEPRRLRERRFCNSDQPLDPGAKIEITTDDYRLKTPGTYEFTVDLVDELKEHFFADMGSPVVRKTLVVR